MDGLTNIIAKIKEQNEADCTGVVDSAKQKAAEILANAQKTAESINADYNAKTQEAKKIISSKAVSSSELEYKRVILAQKSRILDELIEKSVESIAKSTDEAYFGYIETLVKSNALSGKGSIRMSQDDLKRLPEGYEKKLNSELCDGKEVVISKEPIDCVGGFVIEYDEIRIDCTLSSLVEDKYDEIRDEINKILFA